MEIIAPWTAGDSISAEGQRGGVCMNMLTDITSEGGGGRTEASGGDEKSQNQATRWRGHKTMEAAK